MSEVAVAPLSDKTTTQVTDPTRDTKQLDGFLGKVLCAASVTSVTSETKELKEVKP